MRKTAQSASSPAALYSAVQSFIKAWLRGVFCGWYFSLGLIQHLHTQKIPCDGWLQNKSFVQAGYNITSRHRLLGGSFPESSCMKQYSSSHFVNGLGMWITMPGSPGHMVQDCSWAQRRRRHTALNRFVTRGSWAVLVSLLSWPSS